MKKKRCFPDYRRHRFFFASFLLLCRFVCAESNMVQIFVNKQTNISIENIFDQAFRYRESGKRVDSDDTG